MSLTSIATRGYLCEFGSTPALIAVRGYLGCIDGVIPLPEEEESTVKGGRSKKQARYERNEDIILAVLKAFVQCQDDLI
jgi:hypothetical protein